MTGRAPLWRQRLPFAGLCLAAIAGIAMACVLPVGSGFFLVLTGVALFAWMRLRRSLCIYFAVAFLFATLHVIHIRESASAALAKSLGEFPHLAQIDGTVRSEPQVSASGKSRFVIDATRIEISGQNLDTPCKILVTVPGITPALEDTVKLTGSLQPIPPPRNPGQFDAKRFMELHGITCELKVTSPLDMVVTAPANSRSLQSLAVNCRKWMDSTLRSGISSDPLIGNLLAGIVLGVTADLPDTLKDEFRQTGTFHLFSVSGLHVGMIAVILWQVFRIAGLGRSAATAITIPALYFYALLTGWQPSSVRAASMTAIFLVGMVSSRQPVALNSLCAAAFVILLQSTNELFSPGFQLSFTVVAAILLIATPLHDGIRKRLEPDAFIPVQIWTFWEKKRHAIAGGTAGLLSVSLAAWIGSLPLTIFYFHMISLSALVANLIVVPLSFLIMATAVLSLTTGLVSLWVAGTFNNANLFFTKILLVIIQAAASIPGSFLPVGGWLNQPAVLTVFDFGSGGATAIQTGNRLWLVDCGSKWDFENVVTPWMRGTGHWTPDTLVLTHGDADHIGGVSSMLETESLPPLIDSPLTDRSPIRRRLNAMSAQKNLPPLKAQAGTSLKITPSARLEILHPPAELVAKTADDKTLVLRFDCERTKCLILSDAGPSTCDWLLQNQSGSLAADILILGRHTSGIMPEAAFLRAIRPSLIVATASAFPEKEAIDESWAAMVGKMGIQLFRQDQTGAVTIRITQNSFDAEGFLNSETFNR